jgi:hypothetical protein
MAVAVVSSSSSNFANATTNAPSFASVAATAGDLIVYAATYRVFGGSDISTAPTWNGQSFTSLASVDITDGTVQVRMEVFYLFAGSSTTANITVANVAFVATAAGYVILSGADSGSPFGSLQSQSDFTSWVAPSLSVSDSDAGDLILECFGATHWNSAFTILSGTTWAPANSQTELFEAYSSGTGGPRQIIAHLAGASGAQTLGYTPSAGQPGYAHIAIAVLAAGTQAVLDVESASAVVSGESVGLLFEEAYVLSLSHAQVVAEPQPIPFILSKAFDESAIVVQGQDINMLAEAILPVEAGQATVAGQDVTLTFDDVLHVVSADVVVRGSIINLIANPEDGAGAKRYRLGFGLGF